ncbi:MAG: hypothetical protein KME17_26080 [Cyanosarcina radialis HA8281-LM2]|jgi:hypothetical protein|nr:hypothetical protein [Cyanosarcina radialis HA8281-LM2]
MFKPKITTTKSFDWKQLAPRTKAEKEKFVWALVITCCVPFIAQQADASTSAKVEAKQLPLQLTINSGIASLNHS